MRLHTTTQVGGKIIKVLDKNGQPKHHQLWMINILIRERVHIGYPVFFYADSGKALTMTSLVEHIEEDENNLVLTTLDSIYYIKKLQ